MTAEDTKRAIAGRIVQLRDTHHLMQKQLADAICLDPSAMNRIEKGERAVSVAEVIRIADFFGGATESILREPESSGVLFRAGEHRAPSSSSRSSRSEPLSATTSALAQP